MIPGLPNSVLYAFIAAVVFGHVAALLYYLYSLAHDPSFNADADAASGRSGDPRKRDKQH